jgi:replicative DNA helicase
MTINKLSEYGHSFQIKILSSLLQDNKFLQNIVDILTPDYFDSEAHKWVIQFILEYFAKYKIYPTLDALQIEIKKQRKESLKVSIIENLREAYNCSTEDLEYVQTEFFAFCKNQVLKAALLQSVDLLKDGNFEDIRRLINNAMKDNNEKDIGLDYTTDVEERYRDDEQKLIDFPWKIFNTITDGGLEEGNLMLLFAPPGIGKTTVAANIAAHCLRQGKNVLFYALEITGKKMGRKIDSIITGIPVKELRRRRSEVDAAMAKLPGRLIIKDYPPRKASLDTIEAHMNKLRLNEGFTPHVVFLDYPELLKVRKSRKETREEVDDVYTEIKGIAMESLIPWICPSQINRSGAKDKIIEGDKVAGSFGKMMIGDLNISLSRDRKDKLNGTGRFHIIKSRLGPDGMTYDAKIDLERGFIDISEQEYDEEAEMEGAKNINGYMVQEDTMKQLSDKFKKFQRLTAEVEEEN